MTSKCPLPPNTSGRGRESGGSFSRVATCGRGGLSPWGRAGQSGWAGVPRRWACPGHGPGRVAASPCPGPAPRPGSLFQGCGRVTAQTWGHPALILWGLGHLCQVEKDRREQAAAPPGLCVERPVRRAGRVRLRDDTPSTEPPRERPGRGRGRRRLSALPTPRPPVPSDRERDRLCPTPGGAAATRAPGSRAR